MSPSCFPVVPTAPLRPPRPALQHLLAMDKPVGCFAKLAEKWVLAHSCLGFILKLLKRLQPSKKCVSGKLPSGKEDRPRTSQQYGKIENKLAIKK